MIFFKTCCTSVSSRFDPKKLGLQPLLRVWVGWGGGGRWGVLVYKNITYSSPQLQRFGVVVRSFTIWTIVCFNTMWDNNFWSWWISTQIQDLTEFEKNNQIPSDYGNDADKIWRWDLDHWKHCSLALQLPEEHIRHTLDVEAMCRTSQEC